MATAISAKQLNVICPSGLGGIVRGLTVGEGNTLAAANGRSTLRRIDSVDSILSACWVGTDNPGPYDSFNLSMPSGWRGVLAGDRDFLVTRIRSLTWGPEYEFSVRCELCAATFRHSVDLLEIPVQKLPDESRRLFADGNKFTVSMFGRDYVFQLATGALARRAAKQEKSHANSMYSLGLRLRVISVSDIETNDITAHLTSLALDQAADLVDAFDEHDCGLETDLEIECEACGSEFEVALPFGAEFFSPRRRNRAARRKRI